MRDLHDGVKVVRAISPAAATTDNTPWVSQIIDCAGFETCEFMIAIGALAAASATFAATLACGNQSNLSDAVAAPSNLVFGSLAGASFTAASDANSTKKIGFMVQQYRYVQLTITPTSNNAAAYASALAVLAGAFKQPQA